MTRRSSEPAAETETAAPEPAAELTFRAGQALPLPATVLRTSGPYVHLSVAGQVIVVLRSYLTKELLRHGS